MKKTKKLIGIIGALCCLLLSISACGGNSIESRLNELSEADSFSVMTNNTVIMQYEGTSLYWKYGESEYTEYYFKADSEGKNGSMNAISTQTNGPKRLCPSANITVTCI